MEDRRFAWKLEGAKKATMYKAEVIGEVHKMDALGAAGIFLKMNDTIEVLDEGEKRESGFNVVRGPAGNVGIYPKAYLRSENDPEYGRGGGIMAHAPVPPATSP